MFSYLTNIVVRVKHRLNAEPKLYEVLDYRSALALGRFCFNKYPYIYKYSRPLWRRRR